MAREEDRWKRQREREDELEAEELLAKKKAGIPTALGKQANVTTEKTDEMLSQAEPLIEQVDNLYAMYFAGVERVPPNVKRKALEQIMHVLQSIKRSTPAANFKVNSMVSRFISYRDRWDRMLRDLESGKIKRTKA